MKERIVAKASTLGFDACRVTTAAPPDTAARFQEWLDHQRHGTMGYLERNAPKRMDPQRVLPGARSIVTLAASYALETRAAPHKPVAESPKATGESGRFPKGWVAQYARYADYHDLLAARLQELAAFVDHLGGPNTRSLGYVDTGPVLERDLAQRAGLGFIGKHTNLISRRWGNWFFLAEIITTLELLPDPPERNRCGSCTRCLEACPTGAILAPFELDARRCLSYLTIELKGPIPEHLRPALAHRIFGCDDCLEVCPWNRFAQAGRIMRDHYRPELAEPDLLGLLALDNAEFKRRFQGTPLLRTKRRGLLRNVCVALGNVGTAQALPALAKAAQDPEPLIAEHAQWAIRRIQSRCSS